VEQVRRRLAVLLLLFSAFTLRGDAPGVFAITGATVHPVSGPDIPDGVVVIRNGLIEAVGTGIAIPPDAMVVSAAGGHVYPGLIDAQTSYGIPAGDKNAPEPSADTLALTLLKGAADDAESRRATGVTTVITAPSAGIFNGRSVALNLGDGPVDAQVLRNPVAMQASFSPRRFWTWPDSLMGVIAYFRQSFLDAQQHAAAREIYERAPAGLQRPADSAELDALRPVIRRELPIVFVADSEPMMHRAMALAHEFNLRYVLSGARQGYEIAGELKNVPTLVSVKWPVAPASREDREEQPLRVIRDRQLAPTTPAALAKSGATFALVSGPGKAGDLMPGVRKAIENGLGADDALRALTIAPARIFAIDRQVGSLEKGKVANVIVTDKPLFDEGSKVTRVFVDGREARLPREDRKPAASTPAPIDGTWSISVQAPQGGVAFQVTLRLEGDKLTGTWSGDRGSGELRGGSAGGATFEFTLSAAAQSGAETTDWVFSGTLEGDAMKGTVTTTLGKFEFTGSRSK
jgi:imidazolonepropionase-like amidohydrolase